MREPHGDQARHTLSESLDHLAFTVPPGKPGLLRIARAVHESALLGGSERRELGVRVANLIDERKRIGGDLLASRVERVRDDRAFPPVEQVAAPDVLHRRVRADDRLRLTAVQGQHVDRTRVALDASLTGLAGKQDVIAVGQEPRPAMAELSVAQLG